MGAGKEPSMDEQTMPVIAERVEQAIRRIRGRRVMLDADLATFYGVSTAALKRAVRRNSGRFPPDFMLQLSPSELDEIVRSRCQFGILKRGANAKFKAYAFTQEGVAMLSGVLRSPRAAQVNIAIMRAFVRLREVLALHHELAHKLGDLERRLEGHDAEIRTLFEAIRQLMTPPDPPPKPIGFHVREPGVRYETRRRRRKP
jgi:hypothetical protein